MIKARKAPRRLFLDDDPARAEIFLAEHPDAVWVQAVPECLTRLAEPWDEVHLDHDLGGEHFVDSDRDDCGMAVVRWLTDPPRDHLRRARFTVHSHNMIAALTMVLHLQSRGYLVQARPFGIEEPEPEPAEPKGTLGRVLAWLKRRQKNVGSWDKNGG